MRRFTLAGKLCIAAVSCLMAFSSFGDAFAREPGPDIGPGPEGPHHEEVVDFGRNRYHYRDGRFYRQGPFGLFDTLIAPPPGLVVTVVPEACKVIIIDDATYYYYEDVYYTKCPNGYVVVDTPATGLEGEPVTVNIPNSDGTYTPVKLFKHKNGYTGPQGEFYKGHPTVEQLKALYGK